MKGNIFEAKTLDELKSMGKLPELRGPIRDMAKKYNIKVLVNSWDNAWASVQNLKNLVPELVENGEQSKEPPAKEQKDDDWDDPFFKSLAAKTIYYLLYVSGEEKTNFLGITRKHYSDKALARSWMLEKMKLVHPDNCENPYADKAADAVTRLYESMTATR